MVETIFLDWLLSFGVGLLFGRFGLRTHNPGAPRLSSRSFRWALLAQGALMTVSVALYSLSPDWMWMYWVGPDVLPVGIVALAFAMYLVAFLAGYLLAPELERVRRGATWVVFGITAVAVTVLEVGAWERLTSLGTVAEFAAGRAGPLKGTFLAVLAIGGLGVVALNGALLRALSRMAPVPLEEPKEVRAARR